MLGWPLLVWQGMSARASRLPTVTILPTLIMSKMHKLLHTNWLWIYDLQRGKDSFQTTYRPRTSKVRLLRAQHHSRNINFWRIRGTMWTGRMDCSPVVKWREDFKVLPRFRFAQFSP